MIPKTLHLQWFFDKWLPYQDEVVRQYTEILHDWKISVERELPADMPGWMSRFVCNEQIPRACRADLARYWTMYMEGGVYVDFDSIPLKYFDARIMSNPGFIVKCNGMKGVSTRKVHGFLDCCLMGSEPKNKFWEHVFERCQMPSTWKEKNVWFAAQNTFRDWKDYGVALLDDAVQEVDHCEVRDFLKGNMDFNGTGYIKHYRLTPYLELKYGNENHWHCKSYEQVYGKEDA